MLEAFRDVWAEVGIYVIGAGLLFVYAQVVEFFRNRRRG